MKLNLSNMDIGTPQFNFVRTLMGVSTGGADVAECLKAAYLIKDNDLESWAREWARLADQAVQTAEQTRAAGQMAATREAYLRASSYYRSAMFSLSPTDQRLNQYIRLSRETFHQAAKLFSPPIEAVEIPFEGARLPGYFLAAGQSARPTLVVINGGDSTNEEMVHWIGFAAVERGWNCCIFEGPGQWSALQMNPGLVLRPDYEVPVKAVLDWLTKRQEVDSDRLALIGYSLSSQLVPRVVAFDKRLSACICVGGIIIDVAEAWEAVMPPALRNAFPGIFDVVFSLFEKAAPQLRSFVNHFEWSLGVTKPHEVLHAFESFTIRGLAPRIQCPMLILAGEGEYQQTNIKTALAMLQFISELTVPITVHEFKYQDGWVASHCSVGDERPAQKVIFDWLEQTVINKGHSAQAKVPHDWSLLHKYHHTPELLQLEQRIHVSAI